MKRFKYDTKERIYKHYCNKCESYKLQSEFYTGYDYVCIECSKKDKTRKNRQSKTSAETLANNKRIRETIANLKKNSLHNK